MNIIEQTNHPVKVAILAYRTILAETESDRLLMLADVREAIFWRTIARLQRFTPSGKRACGCDEHKAIGSCPATC